METTLDLEQLRRCRLFIATPMYGAQCSGHYARPLADLTALCARWGIGIELSFVMHESLITRARNYLAHRFLASDATHLVFIDADIAFHAEDVLMLLQHSVLHPDHQVVSGSYPLKRINWDSVARAFLRARHRRRCSPTRWYPRCPARPRSASTSRPRCSSADLDSCS